MAYSGPHHYLPSDTQYYPTSNANHQVHMGSSTRPEVAQRKRPKYTRSKTGCMTCRVKKIKCDETKPICMRCTHGSRECTWPEGTSSRKKPSTRKDSTDGRPSTAGSSVSEASTPPTREHTPPRRGQLDLNLLPHPSRVPSDSFLHSHDLGAEHDSRRHLDRSSGYGHPPANNSVLSMIPETSYSTRYNPAYVNSHPATVSRQPPSSGFRTLAHQQTSHWNAPPEPLDYYSNGLQERTLIGHSSPNDHSHNRYQ